MAAVGRGEMFSGDVVRAVYPDYKEEPPRGDHQSRRTARTDSAAGRQWRGRNGQPAASRSAASTTIMPVRFAPEGGAVPGDRIVGILTPGEGVTIYPIQSPVARRLRQRAGSLDRRALGRRGGDRSAFPPASSCNRSTSPASLAQITQVIADHDGNIDNVVDETPHPGLHRHHHRPDGLGLKHLNAIIAELRAKRAVSRVDRITG